MNIGNEKFSICLLFVLSFNLFIGVPLIVWKNNYTEIIGVDLTYFLHISLPVFIVFFICLVILYLCSVILIKNNENSLTFVRVIVVYFSLFVVITGYLLPIIDSAGMFSALSPPVNPQKFSLAVIICAVITFGVWRYAGIKLVSLIFVSTVSISSLFYLPMLHALQSEDSVDISDFLSVSTKQNVFVISFDGLPGVVIREALGTSPEFKNSLKDFLFFTNAVAQSPATESSIMGELFGVQDFEKIGPNVDQIVDYYSEQASFKNYAVLNVSENAYALGLYARFVDREQTINQFDLAKYPNNIDSLLDLINMAQCRIGTCIFGKYTNLREIKRKILEIPRYEAIFDRRRTIFEPRRTVYENKLFNEFLAGLKTSEKLEESVRMVHFTHTHFPIRTKENCEIGNHQWNVKHQNQVGMLAQAKCALRQFGGFLKKLKKLGIYDKSVVVLKSDHGKPGYFFDQPPGNISINGHKFWGLNRYQPLLMIKNFDQKQKNIKLIDDVVLLNDLAMTLCRIYSSRDQCEHFNGINLFDYRSTDLVDKNYFVYLPASQLSSHRHRDHVSFRVNSRTITIEQYIENALRQGKIK